tara:strand:+ start:15755 stop:17128 length:1374 start_codon:yes stop_codon:yes gene_type:complete
VKPTPLLIALGLFIILAGFVYYTSKTPSDVDDESQPILQIETNEIQSITILRPGYDSITIRQNEESGWVFGNPHNAIRTDTAAANMIATNLTELSADRIVEENVDEWDLFGLQESGTLRLDATVGEGRSYAVVFGDDTPTGSGVFVRLEGDPRLFTVPGHVKNGFGKEVFDLRDKQLLQVAGDTVSSVVLSGSKKSIEFGKTSAGDWQIVKPQILRADNYVINDLVRTVSNVEMTAVLEDATGSNRRYSFKRPMASVEIIDEKGPHTLTVVQERGGDEKYYAKSSDTVGTFEVSSAVTSSLEKTLDDFRNKKLFDFGFKNIANLDVRDDGTNLQIQKQGDTWRLISQNNRELTSVKVQALIDKLRNLTATAYPSDRAADFVRYDLTKPVVEVKVTTEEGTVDEVIANFSRKDKAYAARKGQSSIYEVEVATLKQIQTAISDVLTPTEESPPSDEVAE